MANMDNGQRDQKQDGILPGLLPVGCCRSEIPGADPLPLLETR